MNKTMHALAALAFIATPAHAQQAFPQVTGVNPNDLFPIIVHGIPSAQNRYVAVNLLANYIAPNPYTQTSLPALSAGSLGLAGLAPTPTLNANGEGAIYVSTSGGLRLQGQGSANDVSIVNNAGAIAASVPTGTTNLKVVGQSIATTFATTFGTTTLSGSTVPTPLGQFQMNLAGTSTVAGNTALAALKMNKSSDNASITNGVWNEILINDNYGGASFTGGRIGMNIQMGLNTASALSGGSDGLVGYASLVYARANAGGSSSGYLGSLFGSNPWCRMEAGATFYAGCRGEEVDNSIETGASVAYLEGFKVALSQGHAVHGTYTDAGIVFGASTAASVGVRNAVLIGSSAAQWPVDPNGYIFQAQNGINFTTDPATAAGGVDLRQVTFSGSGVVGGGFAYASPGFQIDASGRGQFGYGLIDGTSGGVVISSTEQTLSGTPTLVSGGAGFGLDVLAADAYGDILRVAASGGVVTSITSVVRRGWTTSPPSNPVTFNAITGNDPANGNMGLGLTVNETWAGSGNVALGAGSDTVSLPVVGTGTPVASLCLDAGGHIVKKTTSGACI